MDKEVLGYCPMCQGKLIVTRLSCKECGLEMTNEFSLPPISYLNASQKEMLEMFLKCGGNLKALQERLNISYPFAKKKLDNVFEALGYKPIVEEEEKMPIDISNIVSDSNSIKASEIIKSKLIQNGGSALITTINGKVYSFSIRADGKSFETIALPQYPYDFTVFDIIVDLLKANNGKAFKGAGRNAKLGEPKCEIDTVVGAVGKTYSGKNIGDSIFDPVFILAAILEWADICNNQRGYIEFTQSYRMKLFSK